MVWNYVAILSLSARSSNAYKCAQFWLNSELEQAHITITVSLSVCVVELSALFASCLGSFNGYFHGGCWFRLDALYFLYCFAEME